MAYDDRTFTRNSSKDTVIYNRPVTLYTDSTTLVTGMTLYNNTGTDTGYKVGTIYQGNSFDIATQYMDIENYTYTNSNDTITLQKYTGNESTVVVPTLQH